MARTPEKTRVQDFIVTNGDTVRGEDGTAGTPLPMRGGDSSGGNNPGAPVTIDGGQGDGSGAGGDIEVTTGVPGPTGNSGDLRLRTGVPIAGSGGSLSLLGADAAGGNFNAAPISVLTGAGSGTGFGGNLELLTGSGGANGNGGLLEIVTGSGGTVSGAGGGITMATGGPPLGGDGAGGSINIFTGMARGPSNAGGSLTVILGNATGGSAGGTATLNMGLATGVTGTGGSFLLTAGNQPVIGSSGAGGLISLTAGSVTDGTATGPAGSILLIPGTNAGAGPAGNIFLSYTNWPQTDGAASDVLTTDGAGTLSWAPVAAGGESLAATLLIGNNTGATDIEVAAAQSVRGVDSGGGSGTLLNLRGGNSTGGGGSGGAAAVMGGLANGGGAGGSVFVTGGSAPGAGMGGSIQWLTGATGSGLEGDIIWRQGGTPAAQSVYQRTAQLTVAEDTGTATLATAWNLDTDGKTVRLRIYLTGVGIIDGSDVSMTEWDATWHRDGFSALAATTTNANVINVGRASTDTPVWGMTLTAGVGGNIEITVQSAEMGSGSICYFAHWFAQECLGGAPVA